LPLNGAVTLLVVGIAVYLSYTANNGLPFAPTYRISADVPSAGQLVRHADVRIGGARVGQVMSIEAIPAQSNAPARARLHVALAKSVGELPVDSHSEVRLASILGGKYLALVPGHSDKTIADGGLLPVSRARASVDLDQAFRVLDPPTRRALANGVSELGTGFAGRGVTFNQTIGNLAGAAAPLQRVLENLAAPETALGTLIVNAAAASATVEPNASRLAGLVDNGATTLGAVNAAGDALGRSIAALPGAEAQSTATLRHLRPALVEAAALTRELKPAAPLLRPTVSGLDRALRVATPIAPKVRSLAAPQMDLFAAVRKYASDPLAIRALQLLGANDLATFGASGFVGLGGILATVSEAQLNCNTVALWAHNLAGVSGDGDRSGAWVRDLPIIKTNGETQHSAAPNSDMHVNAYPNENANECESGNEPYRDGAQIGNPAGNQGKTVPLTHAPAAMTP
jgi:phospholipid/cholesterol/gamma-HCH transport system substrate-binding protein